MTAAMTMDHMMSPARACAISVATAAKFARLRNHANRAIARSVTSAVRIDIRAFREPTQYIRLVSRSDRCCCVRLRAFHHMDKMRVPATTKGPLPLLQHGRSEEHTSELQSPVHLVCRLLLEKKKKNKNNDSQCTH